MINQMINHLIVLQENHQDFGGSKPTTKKRRILNEVKYN